MRDQALKSFTVAHAETMRLAALTADVCAEAARGVDESRRLRERLRRERYGRRPREGAGPSGEGRRISGQPDPRRAAD